MFALITLIALLSMLLQAQDWQEDLASGSLNGYFTFDELVAFIDEEVGSDSSYITTKGILYGDTPYVSRSSVDSLHKGIAVISAAQYAGFPNAPQLAAYLIKDLGFGNAAIALGTVIIIPMVNSAAIRKMEETFATDGFIDLYTNLNAAHTCGTSSLLDGVNLNRNWPTGFSVETDVCSDDFGGSASLSETETSALEALMTSEVKVWVHIDHAKPFASEDSWRFIRPFSYDTDKSLTAEQNYFYEALETAASINVERPSVLESGTLIDYALFEKNIMSLEVSVSAEEALSLNELAFYSQRVEDILDLGFFVSQNKSAVGQIKTCGIDYTCARTSNTIYHEFTVTFDHEGLVSLDMTLEIEYEDDELLYFFGDANCNITDIFTGVSSSAAITPQALSESWTFFLPALSIATITIVAEPYDDRQSIDRYTDFNYYPTGAEELIYYIDVTEKEDDETEDDSEGEGEDEGEDEGDNDDGDVSVDDYEDDESSSEGLEDKAIVGIIIAGMVLLGGLFWFICLRTFQARRRRSIAANSQKQDVSLPEPT